jgi:single-strand DNA-binding protein
MASRSLNKVILIGNLTRDPELRYTPAGTAVCTFGLATNRTWTTQSGEVKEEAEFHRIVAWNKLAELCSQLLVKGRKVYVEGRLATHTWTTPEGVQRSSTEIVIEDMIILDSKRVVREEGVVASVPEVKPTPPVETPPVPEVAIEEKVAAEVPVASDDGKKSKKAGKQKVKAEEVVNETSENITPDDIPF